MRESLDAQAAGMPGAAQQDVAVAFLVIERLADLAGTLPPAELAEILERTLAVLAPPVASHGGIIDHVSGDCVVAHFGAPFGPDAADPLLSAGRAALAQQAALPALNALL